MDPLLVGLVVVVASVPAPLILAFFLNSAAQKRWRENAARQDVVAEKLASATKLDEEAERRAGAAVIGISGKLEVIHALVNSNLTAAIQEGLDARKAQLVTMLEIIDLKKADARQPTPEALHAIRTTQEKIVELERSLRDRLTQAAEAARLEAQAEEMAKLEARPEGKPELRSPPPSDSAQHAST